MGVEGRLLGRVELLEGRALGVGIDGRLLGRIELLEGRALGVGIDGRLLGRVELLEGRLLGRVELLEGREPGTVGAVTGDFEFTVVRAGGLGRLVPGDFVPGRVGRLVPVPATLPGFARSPLGRLNSGCVRIDAGTDAGDIEGFPEPGSFTTRLGVLAPGGNGRISAGWVRGA
ncbi:MAG: hypothetical protein QGH11_09855, partial [Pirellulaceae bacterium]|nr:hypothetical protein [Pirellulaceae bacterium]